MNPRTLQAYLRDRTRHRRLTVPNHIKKLAARIGSAEAECLRQDRLKHRNECVAKKNGRYTRLDYADRCIIEQMHRDKQDAAAIARVIGCHRSTITNEIKNNSGKRGYRREHAQNMADKRIFEKAAARRKLTPKMWEDAKSRLNDGWTFEQFSEREKKEGRVCVCRETLYKEYYARQKLVLRGGSNETLPLLPMRRRQRKTRDRNAKKYRNAGRGKIRNRVDIDQRPKSVDNRARIGHWEGDLINGNRGTGNLATLSERMSRYTLVAYVATKETDAVMSVMASLLRGMPAELLKTLTFDNGKEFALFEILCKEFGLDVYFAKPYHSWERGTNENRNGIVRRILPKGTDFDHITQEQLDRIDRMLNDRPMKCLGWRTPREVFQARLAYYLKAA